MPLIEFLRKLTYIREAGENRGLRVEAIIHWCGGDPGESWCCFFVTWILDMWFGGASPIPRGGSCEDVYQLAKRNGWIVTEPRPGDLFLYINAEGIAHHIGFVTGVGPLMGLAGNTSEDGTSSNGDGIHEHATTASVFIRVPGLIAA